MKSAWFGQRYIEVTVPCYSGGTHTHHHYICLYGISKKCSVHFTKNYQEVPCKDHS